MERQIVYSGLRTPDGTVIESKHRHDCGTYKDKNGKTYMIDGGLDYVRCSNHGDEETITVYADEPHEKVRQFAFRTGYGKPGDPAYGIPKLTRIADMDDEYLNDAIKYVTARVSKDNYHLKILLTELDWRTNERSNKNKEH